MKKKSILLCSTLVVVAVASLAGYKVYESRTISSQDNLMKQNLEALARDEWDGWSIGYYMDRKWLITGGGAEGSGSGGGGSLEGIWINCCKKSVSTDACDRMGQSDECQ